LTALSTIYPKEEWKPWLFKYTAKAWFESIDNQRLFLEEAGAALEVVTLDTWRHVEPKYIKELGGDELLKLYKGSLINGKLNITQALTF
jgi:hypothetical protein